MNRNNIQMKLVATCMHKHDVLELFYQPGRKSKHVLLFQNDPRVNSSVKKPKKHKAVVA